MAWKRKYRCSACGYEAETYEGKGLFGQHITPVSCPDCHTIQNLVVGGVMDAYAFVVVLTVSAFGMATPVRNVVELWLILKKRSSGHKSNNP